MEPRRARPEVVPEVKPQMLVWSYTLRKGGEPCRLQLRVGWGCARTYRRCDGRGCFAYEMRDVLRARLPEGLLRFGHCPGCVTDNSNRQNGGEIRFPLCIRRCGSVRMLCLSSDASLLREGGGIARDID